MEEQKIYNEIKSLIEIKEINSKVRYLKDNTETLKTYWNIGRLIVEAQGGINRAKYGDNLIKKWSAKLIEKYGKGYDSSNLKRFRKFYLQFQKGGTLSHQLTWSHYRYMLSIKNINERNYYINQVILNNLSVRELQNEIKNKAFERLSYADKQNIKLIKSNIELSIGDMIKDPILIKCNKLNNKLNEKALHKYIIEMLETRFLELGAGFALVGI